MDVKVIGQFRSAGLRSADIRIVSEDFNSKNNSSCNIFAYYVGSNKFYWYKIEFSEEETNPHIDIGVPVMCDNEAQIVKPSAKLRRKMEVCKLVFVKSYRIPFPICFLTSINGNMWAISQDGHLNLKDYINDDGNRQTNSSEDIFSLLLENDEHMDLDTTIQDPLVITDDRILRFERNHICCVTGFTDGLIICRENMLEHCWTVEVLKTGEMAQTLVTVPFVKSPFPGQKSEKSNFQDIFESNKYSENDYKPHMVCITTQLGSKESQRNLVSESTFVSLFGAETLFLSNTVLLIGLPDGRILLHILMLPNFPCQHKKTAWLLCNIEQPIYGIYIVGSDSENSGVSEDMMLIVGVYGKVMILSAEPSQVASITENTPSFAVNISHIPSPVFACTTNGLGILHTSAGGQLWMSAINITGKQISTKSCKYITLDSKQLAYTDIMEILHLSGPQGTSEITLCVAFDGSIYVGNFSEETMGSRISEENIPILLKSIYQYSDELQQLELLAQKQRKLFAAIATAANLKFQATGKIGISVLLTEIDTEVKKFLIDVVFKDLECFNLCSELWSITAKVSSLFHKEETTVSRSIPLSNGKCSVEIEVATSLFVTSSGTVFPLLVEAGLLLCLPEEWKSLSCFATIIQNLPIYIRIETVMITELYVLKSADKATKLKNFSSSSNNCKLFGCENILHSIWNISRNRATYNLLSSEMEMKTYKFPHEFCFYLFLTSAELILKAMSTVTSVKDFDVVEEMLKNIFAKSCTDEYKIGHNLLCLGYPISIDVKKELDSLCITIQTTSFQLLVGLKLSIIKLLMDNYSHACFPSNRKIGIATKIYGQLQNISANISKLMCQDKTAVTAEELELYKMLRKEISSNLYLM